MIAISIIIYKTKEPNNETEKGMIKSLFKSITNGIAANITTILIPVVPKIIHMDLLNEFLSPLRLKKTAK